MNDAKYNIIVGENILDEYATCISADGLEGCELNELLVILLNKNLEVLIRHKGV